MAILHMVKSKKRGNGVSLYCYCTNIYIMGIQTNIYNYIPNKNTMYKIIYTYVRLTDQQYFDIYRINFQYVHIFTFHWPAVILR